MFFPFWAMLFSIFPCKNQTCSNSSHEKVPGIRWLIIYILNKIHWNFCVIPLKKNLDGKVSKRILFFYNFKPAFYHVFFYVMFQGGRKVSHNHYHSIEWSLINNFYHPNIWISCCLWSLAELITTSK